MTPTTELIVKHFEEEIPECPICSAQISYKTVNHRYDVISMKTVCIEKSIINEYSCNFKINLKKELVYTGKGANNHVYNYVILQQCNNKEAFINKIFK